MDSFTTAARELAQSRKQKSDLMIQQANLLEKLANNPDYVALMAVKDAIIAVSKSVAAQEEAFRTISLAHAKATGERDNAAYTVKNYTVFSYEDDKARDWCIKNLLAAVSFDRKSFEKFVKGKNLEFVEETKEERATISSDLGAFLEQEQAVETKPEEVDQIPF
jgi:hypothetical protein